MSQKLHEQNEQEISNNQILKLANEVQLLKSKLVLSGTLRNDAVNEMEIMRKQRDVTIENRERYELMSDAQESRADFNGKVAGWLLAINVALCSSILIYLGVIL